jgi:hypothetical protein
MTLHIHMIEEKKLSLLAIQNWHFLWYDANIWTKIYATKKEELFKIKDPNYYSHITWIGLKVIKGKIYVLSLIYTITFPLFIGKPECIISIRILPILKKDFVFSNAALIGLPYMLERAGLDVQQGNILTSETKKLSNV